MAYRFEAGETVRENFRRISVEQLDRAIQELTDGVKVDPVNAVHDARKALKMERSLLRLGRGVLKSSTRRRQNGRLRSVAGQLSGARDADVMLEALSELAGRYAGQVPDSTWAAIRLRLERERDRARAGLLDSEAIPAAVEELRAIRATAESQAPRGGGWDAIEPGLQRAYKDGRSAFGRARRRPTVENLHDWRKRAKDLWYHLRLLEAAAPLTMKGHVEEAHRLTNLLGDDHDLAVLEETLRSLAPDLGADVGPVLKLIDHRRERLEEEARFAGERLFGETPSAFVRRLRRYWKTARAQAKVARTQPAREVAQATRSAPFT